MPKGQYIIDDTRSNGRADTSFRACTIGLVIFIFFCVTVIVVAYCMKASRATSASGENGGKGTSDKLIGKSYSPSSTSPPSERKSESEPPSSGMAPTDHPAPKKNVSEEPTSTSPSETTPVAVALGEHESSRHHVASEPRSDSEDPPVGAIESTVMPPLPPTTPLPPAMCENVECRELASTMLSMMGHDAKICTNFYDYACGGLRRNKFLLEHDYANEAYFRIIDQVNQVNDSSPKAFHKFKTLMQSCVSYDTNKQQELWRNEVLEEMNGLGLTVVNGTFTANFSHLFLGLLRHNRPFIFEVLLDVDDTNTTKFALKIIPSQLAVNSFYPVENLVENAIENGVVECQAAATKLHNDLDTIYEETQKCLNKGEGRKKTLDAAKKALTLLHTSIEADKLNEILQHYAEFLDTDSEAIGNKASRLLEIQHRDAKEKTKTVTQMNKMFGNLNIDWTILIEGLINRTLEGERIELYAESYFTEMNEKFITERHQRLHNALLAAFAAARHQELLSAAEQRWRRLPEAQLNCARVAAQLLPDAAAALYLRAFPARLRHQLDRAVEDLFSEVTIAFQDELDRAKLSDDVHHAVQFKVSQLYLSNTTVMAALDDTAAVDADLEHYMIHDNNFVKNAINLMMRNRKLLYERINKKPKDCIWTHFITPYATKGISIYSLQTIAIPLGATEKPFFHPTYPPHIRMAGMGSVIAHEVAHHFDWIGIKVETNISDAEIVDYRGKLPTLPPWTRDVEVEYLNNTGSDRHKHFKFTFDTSQSELKKLEIIADMMGIKLAYKALKEAADPKMLPFLPLTLEQSFFLHLSQKYCTKEDFFSQIVSFFDSPHFPEEPRVKLMLQNNNFYEAFNCSGDRTDYYFPYGTVVDGDGLGETVTG